MGKQLSRSQSEAICRERAKGLGPARIARELGMDYGRVKRHLERREEPFTCDTIETVCMRVCIETPRSMADLVEIVSRLRGRPVTAGTIRSILRTSDRLCRVDGMKIGVRR